MWLKTASIWPLQCKNYNLSTPITHDKSDSFCGWDYLVGRTCTTEHISMQLQCALNKPMTLILFMHSRMCTWLRISRRPCCALFHSGTCPDGFATVTISATNILVSILIHWPKTFTSYKRFPSVQLRCWLGNREKTKTVIKPVLDRNRLDVFQDSRLQDSAQKTWVQDQD